MAISDVMSMGTSWDCSLYCPTNSSLTPKRKHIRGALSNFYSYRLCRVPVHAAQAPYVGYDSYKHLFAPNKFCLDVMSICFHNMPLISFLVPIKLQQFLSATFYPKY